MVIELRKILLNQQFSMQTSFYPTTFLKDKFLPLKEANIPITTHAFNYGTAAFGGFRGYKSADGKSIALFHLEDHCKRLLQATKILNIPSPYPLNKLVDLAITLVTKNKPTTDIYVRQIIYNSSTQLTPNLNKSTYDFGMYMFPLGEYLDINKGLKVCVSSWTRVGDNMIPARGKFSGAYMNSSLARAEAEWNGFDEAIVLDREGHVAEGSSENLFLVRDGVLTTSPVTSDILEGITRSSILTVARDLGIPVAERIMDRTELYICDEAFFSGTGAQVAWISSVDHRKVATGKIGPITQKLQKTFFDVVRGKIKKYDPWRTVISI